MESIQLGPLSISYVKEVSSHLHYFLIQIFEYIVGTFSVLGAHCYWLAIAVSPVLAVSFLSLHVLFREPRCQGRSLWSARHTVSLGGA